MKRPAAPFVSSASSSSEDDNQSPTGEHKSLFCSIGLPSGDSKYQKRDVDSMLADDLNKLSLKERQSILEELHGVPDIVEETPQFCKSTLDALRLELTRTRSKRGYDRALFLSPRYVESTDFLMMFLRADSFNAMAAARRLVAHFDSKLDLFGLEKLVKDITQEDLSEDDLEALYSGSSQVLPEMKDRAGRPFLFDCVPRHHYREPENLIRAIWYQLMNVVKDANIQKIGGGAVVYSLRMEQSSGEEKGLSQIEKYMAKAPTLAESIPLRATFLHFCYDHPAMYPAVAAFQL
ncbi:hypothetical protein, partial [Flagellimonas marinaquae]